MGRKLFTARISTDSPTQSDVIFDAFLFLTLERMHPSTLRKYLSHGNHMNARLMERKLQTEWLTSATTAVPLENTISPDICAVYGSSGYLDFYINGGLRWGVELRIEGKRSADHVARFASDGRYSNIPFTHWAIIDFRHHSTVPKKPESNVWYYNTITVRRQGHEDKVITLCCNYDSSPIVSENLLFKLQMICIFSAVSAPLSELVDYKLSVVNGQTVRARARASDGFFCFFSCFCVSFFGTFVFLFPIRLSWHVGMGGGSCCFWG